MGIKGKGDPTPFLLEGGQVGVLLIHGLTGSAAEMRPIGEFLNQRGLTVLAPLLPGHGTQVEDLNHVKWGDWTTAVEQALADLRGHCRQVFVAGLSMGGLLTLYLASRHPDLPGFVTYAAALDITDWRTHFAPIFRRLLKTVPKHEDHWADPDRKDLIWCYDVWPVGGATEIFALRDIVKASLPEITSPALVIFSKADPTVSPTSAKMILDHIRSKDKEVLFMEECGHVMTVDAGWDTLAQRTYDFVMAHSVEPSVSLDA